MKDGPGADWTSATPGLTEFPIRLEKPAMSIIPDTREDVLAARVRDLTRQLGFPPPVGRVMVECGVDRADALAALDAATAAPMVHEAVLVPLPDPAPAPVFRSVPDVEPAPEPPAESAPGSSTSETGTPKWVRLVTIGSVALVAIVAFVVSFEHVTSVADKAGEGWRSHLIPLSVDGLLVASSMALYVRRRSGGKAGVLPWVGLVLGLVASLAANVAAARPELVAMLVSAWPTVALAVSFELLIRATRADGVGPNDGTTSVVRL